MHYYYYCYYYNHPGSSDGLLVLCLCLSVCFCVFLCSRVNDTMFKCLEPASVKCLVYAHLMAVVAANNGCYVCTTLSTPRGEWCVKGLLFRRLSALSIHNSLKCLSVHVWKLPFPGNAGTGVG